MKGLVLLQWNLNGYRARYPELRTFLIKHPVDIVCLQETRLCTNALCTMPGYSVIRKDRPQGISGGLAILVRQGINYTEIPYIGNLECQSIQVKSNTMKIDIFNMYFSPSDKVQETDIDELFNGRNRLILGDVNARSTRWGSDRVCSRGRIIEKCIDRANLVVLNTGEPTHMDYHSGTMSHIDLSLATSNLSSKINWSTLNNLMGSDHNPIKLTVNETVTRQNSSQMKWNLKKADWNSFREELEKTIKDTTIGELNIDQYNDVVVKILETAASITIPKMKTGGAGRLKELPYWNEELSRTLYERNRARNKFRRSRNLEDLIEFKRLKSVAQKLLRNTAREYWRNYVSTITPNTATSKVWGMIKRMKGVCNNHTIDSLKVGNEIFVTSEEKAEALAKQYANVSSDKNFTDKFQKRKRDYESSNTMVPISIPPSAEAAVLNSSFTLSELNAAIHSGKKNKSPGHDGIPYEFFQNMPGSARDMLLTFYNSIWDRGVVPSSWKKAIVVPILKVGKDTSSPASYRPISLTSTLSKLMEKMVSTRLKWFLEKHDLLTQYQAGFREGRSTNDHLVKLQDNIMKQLNTGGHVLSVFLDIEKAFDMMWGDGLILKLSKLGIGGKFLGWVESFFKGSIFSSSN